MVEEITFPTNKKYAMLFRRRSPPQNMITAQFPNPKVGQLSPGNVSISGYRKPETIEEALTLTDTPPRPPPHYANNALQSRPPVERSQSSEYFLEIKRSLGPREPKSKKTNFATIHTDATETQPAFESDAFAIQMPTTREPVLDKPIYRAKLPSPSRAQVEAYQTYKQKAQQVRERNNSEGVRVPSKIISYDYAYATENDRPSTLELNVSPPASPTQVSPAGSFPISPPVLQQAWTRPKQQVQVQIQGPRDMSDSRNISIARKPMGLGNTTSTTPPRYYQRGDADVGATRSTPSPVATPTKIKVCLKPRVTPSPPQKESIPALYNRSPQSSTDGSCSSSPTKSTPNFAYTTPGVADTIFGYGSKDISGTSAPKPETPKSKKTPEKRTLTSRWAWLRPTGPRVAKPASTQPTTSATIPKATTYVDPFVLHATPAPTNPSTPTASRPASPKKLTRITVTPAATARPATEKGKFETGFAQITSLGSLMLKICLLVYALVGLYFLLDAVREAVHALGAPFRVVKMVLGLVWVGVVWVARMVGRGGEGVGEVWV